ncbi:hypothetical protein FRB98_002297 [Tulasnella sp. 332]|nr:hypothetical protein FRB98_002297 [Tulasnella sp. 332]
MDPTYIANLHTLLAQTVAPDTNVIKSATASLNQNYYKDPTCIPALYEILATSPEQNVRQLSAVELRKRISQGEGKLWSGVPEDVRRTIKTKVFENIMSEQASIVRHSMARVISSIANIELPLDTWPDLLPFLQQATSSPTATHREVGIFVLFSVLEAVIDALKEQTSSLFTIFSQLLVDPESTEVRVTTVRALGTLAQFIEADEKADIKKFQALLPGIIGVVSQSCASNNEDDARHGFDVIETLLILESPLLSKNIPDLVQFCLSVGANKSTDDEIRQMALNALNWTIKYKKSKIQSLNLAKPIMEVLLPIGSEADPEDNDEDSPSRLAFRAVDALATVLPPNQVFPPLHALVTGYMQSPDPGLRKSAMMAFGVTVEGCSEFIRPHMKSLWPLIDTGLSDPEPIVRKAACIAFACICEWLEEECAERHAVLLPVGMNVSCQTITKSDVATLFSQAIINLTEDPATQGPACTALDAYLEILELEIGNYLPMIMQRLTGLLATAPMNVKAIVTGAIGSAAHASKGNFTPYFEETMTRLRPFLSLTQDGEEMDLRGISTDAIGTIAEAVGKTAFTPYVPEIMKTAFEGVALGSARLKECSFLFFGVLAKVFGDDFGPYVPMVVPLLLESMKQNEGGTDELIEKLANENPDAFSTGATGAQLGNAMMSTDLAPGEAQVVDIDPTQAISVNSAIAIEKEIAADTMGVVFAATHNHFLPYLEPCTLELVEALQHYYEGIRKSAISSLFAFMQTFYELSGPEIWEPGARVTVPLHEKVRDLVQHTLAPILELWSSEDDKSVVSALCADLSETIAKIGPGLLDGHLEEICQNVKIILEGKSLCQQDPDAEEDEEPLEDQAEFDSVLISSTSDVVATLASVLGADFAQVFGTFLPLIAKNTAKNKSSTDRASAVGTIGEVITGMKNGITAFTQPILQITFAALSDEDSEVRSNAAFAAGVLIENSDADISADFQYMHILNALKPMFIVNDASTSPELHGRDNAAGAVSRMILKNSSALPLDQVLPVLYSALPLKNDYLENTPMYRGIFHLFRTNEAMMMNFVDVLVPAFGLVLAPDAGEQLTEEIRAELIQLIHHLKASVPGKVAPLAAVVPGL